MTEVTMHPGAVAVVGRSGRFPGAPNLEAFWTNLMQARDTISHFRPEELEPSRLELPGIRHLPNYVRARGILDGVGNFDAAFFGIAPREAEVMDPQHRQFLEVAWEALENARCDPAKYVGVIGVWATMSNATYYLENILTRPDVLGSFGPFQAMVANEKDFLATRVSYKLGLRGPSVNVYTACSSSLVAVCQAVSALQAYQCDLALAGGVTVASPQRRGHLHQEGAIGTADGTCRPFDARASGTLFSDGVGVVALKRLEDALADGDAIAAVIRGAAVNNDGAEKASYSAPSVNGQVEVVSLAQELAATPPDSITYVEAHGTATPLGDPVEVAALTQAFRMKTQARQYCVLGSVKSNIGHLDAAAGIAGLIKTILALEHRTIPPTAHFESPNPAIDFPSSPFVVTSVPRSWDAPVRRAGVSSFGIGGTNAHVVLEEAPAVPPREIKPADRLLILSARTEKALAEARARLAAHLAGSSSEPNALLADAAYSLAFGRKDFEHRCALACATVGEAISALKGEGERVPIAAKRGKADPRVVFLFPGQGSQRAGMARRLYSSHAIFKDTVDACCSVVAPIVGLDLRQILFAGDASAEARLAETSITQPALFAMEMAWARLLMSLGIQPDQMVGHSLGEYAAACLAGVFPLERAAVLVAHRGRLMQAQPRGSMMAVRLGVEALTPMLEGGVVVAAMNAPDLTVVSGPTEPIAALEARLKGAGVVGKVLPTSHAFHSPMMDGALADYAAILAKVAFAPPTRTWISCVTGEPIAPEAAVDPAYWVRQLRQPVCFSKGIELLGRDPDVVFLEVGPGQALTSLVRMHRGRSNRDKPVLFVSDREADQEPRALLEAVGGLWCSGVKIDWRRVWVDEPGRRIPLPTYPFEAHRHWVEPGLVVGEATPTGSPTSPGPISATPAGRMPSAGAPTSTLADRVCALLSSAGGVPAADVDLARPLLDLGFDSLLMTQLGATLQREFGVSLTMRELLGDFSTPGKLIAHLASKVGPIEATAASPVAETPAPSPTGCTVLRQGGSKAIFFVYDGFGDVFPYLKLARRLPPDYTAYGLLPCSGPGIPQAHDTVEAMAAYGVGVVRSIQPRGPYVLGGLCAGGVVAFAMAHQLEAQGERVSKVLLLDAINPQLPVIGRPSLRERWQRVIGRVQGGDGAPGSAAAPGPASVRAPAMPAESGIGWALQKIWSGASYDAKQALHNASVEARRQILRRVVAQGKAWPTWLPPLTAFDLFMRIGTSHKPRPLQAEVVLVRATEGTADPADLPARHTVRDPLLGWQGLTHGTLHVVDAQGGHITMLQTDDLVEALAKQLTPFLAAAE